MRRVRVHMCVRVHVHVRVRVRVRVRVLTHAPHRNMLHTWRSRPEWSRTFCSLQL